MTDGIDCSGDSNYVNNLVRLRIVNLKIKFSKKVVTTNAFC
jgi:hypothetical protein